MGDLEFVSNSSSSRKTWAETFYWGHLTPMFKVDLHGDFHSSLEIPQHFVENVSGKLPSIAELKGPQHHETATWRVELTYRGKAAVLHGKGWKKFASDFLLQEGDSLIFEYKNNSYFSVRAFSWRTCCEKESSYFAKNSFFKERRQDKDCQDLEKIDKITQGVKYSRRGCGGINEAAGNDSERSADGFSGPRAATSIKRRKSASSDKEESAFTAYLFQQQMAKFRKDGKAPAAPPGFGSPTSESIRKRSQLEEAGPTFKSQLTSRAGNLQESKSIAARDMRAEARARANYKPTDQYSPFFTVDLFPSHVSKDYRMGIPKWWWEKVINVEHPVKMKIRLKGDIKSYGRRVYGCYYDGSSASIRSGWRYFVQENSLQEHDQCRFRLAEPWSENDEYIHMEVEINP